MIGTYDTIVYKPTTYFSTDTGSRRKQIWLHPKKPEAPYKLVVGRFVYTETESDYYFPLFPGFMLS